MDDQEIEKADLVARACRLLGTLDITTGASGHVSARLDEGMMLIKGKGLGEVGLRYTGDRDIIKVDMEANKIDGVDDLQPPSESFLHLWLYRTRPEVNSVVHMHPEHAVLLSVCDRELVPITMQSARFLIDGVARYERAVTIHSHALGEEFAGAMGAKSTCLMRGHGITVTGTTVEDATVRTLNFAGYMTLLYKAYLLGDPKPISDEDLEHAANSSVATGRVRGTPGGMATVTTNWRYYEALAEEKSGNRAWV
jgi:ribulose-5-phosphate 4-epimerase/fuculose-1-phosphate aldolase